MGRTIGVYFDDDLLEKGQAKAAAQGGKFSTYVQRLIASDLSNESPKPLSPTIIEDLARVLIGELDAKAVAERLEVHDQPKVLQKWLRELAAEPNDSGVIQEMLDEHARQESPAQRILRQNRKRSNGTES
jgi:hypothetical protein